MLCNVVGRVSNTVPIMAGDKTGSLGKKKNPLLSGFLKEMPYKQKEGDG